MLAERLVRPPGDLGEEDDGDPLRRVPHALSRDEAEVKAAGEHEEGDEDRAQDGLEGQPLLELRRLLRFRRGLGGSQIVGDRHLGTHIVAESGRAVVYSGIRRPLPLPVGVGCSRADAYGQGEGLEQHPLR